MQKPLAFCLVFFLSMSLACSLSQFGQDSTPAGARLYQDDFTDSQSGWGVLTSDAGVAGYSKAAYHIYIKSPNINLWAHPDVEFGAARIEVDVVTTGGPSENRMGLICRMKDAANFYYFVISDDGYYGIGKVKNGQWSLLETKEMRPSAAILKGRQTNRLRADCVDGLFAFYVNNHLVGTAADNDFPTGNVGILAGSFDSPGVDVYFDNFVVYKP